jgi:hypothetical protein
LIRTQLAKVAKAFSVPIEHDQWNQQVAAARGRFDERMMRGRARCRRGFDGVALDIGYLQQLFSLENEAAIDGTID